MLMLFKQRLFSWFDSYDIFDRDGRILYTVKGQLAWGHCLKIYDAVGNEVGMVKERIFTLLPKFEIYKKDTYVGCISKEFTFFKPAYNIDFNGWNVEGNFLEWNYSIKDASFQTIAYVDKQVWNWTDTYTIEVFDPDNALYALMLVLAIDAEKCSRD